MESSIKKLSAIKDKAKVFVLASGAGSTFEALVKYSKTEECAYEVVGVASSKAGAGVLNKAKQLGVPGFYIRSSAENRSAFFDEVLALCEKQKADIIALAGFLLLVQNPLLSRYSGKILNTHPSLLPLFGGKGMYGEKVHQAVIREGHKESGVTIHLVDEHYDQGRILAAERVSVLESDDHVSLSERVKAVEQRLYPRVLSQFAQSLWIPQ